MGEKTIMMNGVRDVFTVTELERIFGLSPEYTKSNLSNTKHRKLIGRSWCVRTMTALLSPLRKIIDDEIFDERDYLEVSVD